MRAGYKSELYHELSGPLSSMKTSPHPGSKNHYIFFLPIALSHSLPSSRTFQSTPGYLGLGCFPNSEQNPSFLVDMLSVLMFLSSSVSQSPCVAVLSIMNFFLVYVLINHIYNVTCTLHIPHKFLHLYDATFFLGLTLP